MFINIKVNIKLIIIIISIVFLIIFGFTLYKIFSNSNGLNNNPNLITLNTSNYTNILKEMHTSLDIYIGHKINVNGFIHRQENFENNQFVIARNMIICCESDPAIVGMMCIYDKASEFEDNTWVRINGIVDKYNYDGFDIPIINVSNIEKINTPKNRNVLPPTI